MFVKPGHRQDDPALPLIVRGPNKRLLSPQGEHVPEITFWHRRVRDGDVVLAEPPTAAASASTACGGRRDSAGGRPRCRARGGRRFRVPPAAGEPIPPAAAEHDAAAPLPTHEPESPEGMPLAETKP